MVTDVENSEKKYRLSPLSLLVLFSHAYCLYFKFGVSVFVVVFLHILFGYFSGRFVLDCLFFYHCCHFYSVVCKVQLIFVLFCKSSGIS